MRDFFMCDILMCENVSHVFHRPTPWPNKIPSPPTSQPLECADMIQSIDHFVMGILLSNMLNIKPNSNYIKFKLVFI